MTIEPVQRGNIVLILNSNPAYGSPFALVTRADKKSATVQTDTHELEYEHAQLKRLGHLTVGTSYGNVVGRRFRRMTYHTYLKEWNFDVITREPGETGEVTAVGELRKLAFARLLKAIETGESLPSKKIPSPSEGQDV